MARIDLNSPLAMTVWRNDTVGALYELAKRAPGETARIAIGNEEVLLLQDAHAVRHVLHTNGAAYDKNLGGFEGFFGESRITSDGTRWELLQQLSQPYISAAQPAKVVDVAAHAFAAAAESMLAGVDPAGGVAVDRDLDRAAVKVVTEVALDFDTLDVHDRLMDDFRDILSYGSQRSWNLGGASLPDDAERRARYLRAREHLGQVITSAAAGSTRGGLLGALKQGASDHGVDLVGEVCTLLFAGFDTSAAAVSWGAFLLAAMPDLQVFLRAKVRDACGEGVPTLEQLNAIPELAAFQNEVLRMFPPIPMLGRIANAADRIGDQAVAKGQRVLISIIGLHHDSNHFPNPASLRLARYPEGRMTREQSGHLLPFGTGRRACGGSRLANAELNAAFAVLLQKLQFSIPDHRPLRFEWNASLRRKGGQYLLVRAAP